MKDDDLEFSTELLSDDLEDLDNFDIGDDFSNTEEKELEIEDDDKRKDKRPLSKKAVLGIFGGISILVFLIILMLPKVTGKGIQKIKEAQETEKVETTTNETASVSDEKQLKEEEIKINVEKNQNPEQSTTDINVQQPNYDPNNQQANTTYNPNDYNNYNQGNYSQGNYNQGNYNQGNYSQPVYVPKEELPVPTKPELYQKQQIQKPTSTSATINSNQNNRKNTGSNDNSLNVSNEGNGFGNGNSSSNRTRIATPVKADGRNTFLLQTGTYIPIAMTTTLNSDNPSWFMGIIRENVYSQDGRHKLLIPMGSKIIGSYEALKTNTQTRMMMFTEKIILPNQEVIMFSKDAILDLKGEIGTRGRLNQKLFARFGNAILSLGFNALDIYLKVEDIKNKRLEAENKLRLARLANPNSKENLANFGNQQDGKNELIGSSRETLNSVMEDVRASWEAPKNRIIIPVGSRLNVFVQNDFVIKEYNRR